MTVELAVIGMVAFAFALAGVLLLILFRMELRRQEEVVAVLQRLYQDQHSQRQAALRDLNQLRWTGQTESEPFGEEGR